MDCINASKFIKQPKTIQEKLKIYALDNLENFTEFAKPIGETGSYKIFYLAWIERNEATFISLMDGKQINKSVFNLKDFIPMYNETNLRRYIEEKTNLPIKLQPRYINHRIQYQVIAFVRYQEHYLKENICSETCDNALEAYWQVAVNIAEHL